jgi:hypothetical protein
MRLTLELLAVLVVRVVQLVLVHQAKDLQVVVAQVQAQYTVEAVEVQGLLDKLL